VRVPNVTPDDPFDAVRDRVRAEIETHFKVVLNRPEILNRIGENVIVFDFIRADVAREILDGMLRGLMWDLRQTLGIEVRLADAAAGELRAHCLQDLSNGGRGIRNQVETHLLNPLARALFAADGKSGDRFEVTTVRPGAVTTLELVPLPAEGG
jgi:ATP-dependent Clp protease ATP-binding subunit ClpA